MPRALRRLRLARPPAAAPRQGRRPSPGGFHPMTTSASSAALLERLRAIVGANHLLNEGDLTAYEQDWRKRSRGKALAVVRPADAQQVAEVVKACAEAGTAVIPQGGNTGLA
ncbi:MAG: FAD-binding oxidoreductase, partial [Hydrogenophaga sp.]